MTPLLTGIIIDSALDKICQVCRYGYGWSAVTWKMWVVNTIILVLWIRWYHNGRLRTGEQERRMAPWLTGIIIDSVLDKICQVCRYGHGRSVVTWMTWVVSTVILALWIRWHRNGRPRTEKQERRVAPWTIRHQLGGRHHHSGIMDKDMLQRKVTNGQLTFTNRMW